MPVWSPRRASINVGTARPVLLTVSGTIPTEINGQVASGDRPRVDYQEMARLFDAELLDFAGAAQRLGRVGPLLRRLLGPNLTLALACFGERKRREVLFTDSERVGLPLALALRLTRRRRTARHVMIAHRMSAPAKVCLHRVARLQAGVDRIIAYASSQRDFLVNRLGYQPEQVVLTPFMADTRFWAPGASSVRGDTDRRMICAVGRELRDYATLVTAVRGLDIDLVICAGSTWSKRRLSTRHLAQPPNVRFASLSIQDLRQLYQDAAFVVVPLVDNDFQAGITAILESMAMGKATICTMTAGQTDTLIESKTGFYVPPADAGALRAAIQRLMEDPKLATTVGEAARSWVVSRADIDVYVATLADAVQTVRSRPLGDARTLR